MVDVVFGAFQAILVILEYAAKDVARPNVLDVPPNRREQFLQISIVKESLPKRIVLVDIVFKVVRADRTVITPRVAPEELIASRTGQHYFDELARQLRGIVVRIT